MMNTRRCTTTGFPWRIVFGAILLVAFWTIFVHLIGWRAELAESNLQANLIRITRYLREPSPDIVLVGSSVGGRLLPSYFEENGARVLNLGLDGSCPMFAFEVIRIRAERPRLILLDTSTLFSKLGVNDAVLRDAMESLTTKLGPAVPFFRPEMRPLAIVYNKLKSWKESATLGQKCAPVIESPAQSASEEPETYADVKAALQKFKAEGVEIIFLDIPHGAGWAMPSRGPARQLAEELGCLFLQPGLSFSSEGDNTMRFTDGIHLDAPSAMKLTEWISARLHVL
jgi:hypothetical protein